MSSDKSSDFVSADSKCEINCAIYLLDETDDNSVHCHVQDKKTASLVNDNNNLLLFVFEQCF